MPEPKRGYQVRIKQPVRQSSITCIPTHTRSWYRQDRRAHILSLLLCIFVSAQRAETCLLSVPTLVPLPRPYCNVLPTDRMSSCGFDSVTCQASVSFHGRSFIPAGPACLSVTVSSSKPRVEVHEHTGETVHADTVSVPARAQLNV